MIFELGVRRRFVARRKAHMRIGTLLRYGIWAGIVQTAYANRRYYHMTTTWLPHLATNSAALLLPDLYRLVAPAAAPRATSNTVTDTSPLHDEWNTMQSIFTQLVADNPSYVAYVAPLAAGYLLSHPQFNIYKGHMADLRLAGLGLDALPHSSTAFALTALTCDTAAAVRNDHAARGLLAGLFRWGAHHQTLFSGMVLILATAIWEFGEYRIYRHEMAQRGDMSKINMQWSVQDMLSDCASNTIGWAVALAWRTLKQHNQDE
jgi:hypothetical protein